MIGYLLVAAGAAVGAPLRYLIDRVVQNRWDTVMPFGTLAVNILGSLLLGIVVAATFAGSPTNLEILIGTGFCGTLTTYSTFSYEAVRLLQERTTRPAIAYAVVTVVAGIAAAAAGFAVTTAIAA